MNSHINKPQSVLLLGAGYVAKHLVPTLLADGYDITVTTRRGQTDIKSVTCLPFDGTVSPALRRAFKTADIILSSIPPTKNRTDPVLDALRHVTPSASWVGYLSATSVYGDRQGKWAFEGEAPTPTLQRGKARADAEIAWIETYWSVHIFRLAGIYGPGRSPFDKIRNNKARAVIKAGHVVNRIHVSDIVSAIRLSLEKPSPQAIYNLADGHPAPPQDVLDYAAGLIDQPAPPRITVESSDMSEMARSFYAETKRINADRARVELGWTPEFSDYKAGLKAVLKAENQG